MIFTTWAYAAFLIAAVVCHWLAPPRARPFVLIAGGAFFYGWYHPPHLPLMLLTVPLVWAVGHRVAADRRAGRRGWLVAGVVACLAALAWAKYAAFFGGLAGVAVTPPRAPLGISFFVFEYVHYLVEIGRGTIAPAGLRQVALFALFFPTLICGPIKRFPHFHPEHDGRWPDAAALDDGLRRILLGVAKKTLIADALAPWCAPIFTQPEAYGWARLWLGVYAYAFQIYFDFAGYSDIAIGSARLLGYRVPENFAAPYRQPNVAAFWRSWHMSLTSWITDYVYVPLGGNRGGPWRAALNRMIAMSLCGLWHGAGTHFVLWGAYHGAMLNAYRAWTVVRPPSSHPSRLGRFAATVLTFHVVCIGWVLFAADLHQAAVLIPRLLRLR